MRTIFSDDFASFKLGAFPFDREHSAMGEYHFYPEQGYKGQWYDPITNWSYRGPSWLVTDPALDGKHAMEQQRICEPGVKKAVPCLRAGSVDWKDYTVTLKIRPALDSHISGVLFRYQTSMMHYGFFLVKGGVEFHRVDKLERTVLVNAKADWDPDDFHELKVTCQGSNFRCYLDGRLVIEAVDDTWKSGCIALCACIPTQYKDVKVEMSEKALQDLEAERKAHEEAVKAKAATYPKAKLWKKINLKDYGGGRQIRFGHLTGTKEMFFVICQNQRRVYKDRYPFISCMTAVSFETGEPLWQIGEPSDKDDTVMLTTDLPFQVYDIDGDGKDEVIASWNGRLMILEGATGKVIKSIPTPLNDQDPKTVTSLEFGEYASKRLNVDAIRIVNVSGNPRPSDILIKDRYSRLWVYDKDFNLLWKFSKYNTGHFPYNYDFDGDGKDEIYSCYNLIDHDGKLLWSLPILQDHTDEMIVGRFNPDAKDEQIAMVSGWEGFMIVDKQGKILVRDINGHAQRISIGNYLPERRGLEICTTTYWGNNAIIYMHDCTGKELWHKEMLCNGNIITPLNWDGSGTDLILLNADPKLGGLVDGNGDLMVSLPDDGHPCLASEVLDVTGDKRPEILTWDNKWMYIYTQDGEARQSDKGIYDPEGYPMYNASNYRGEYSFPRWTK